MKKIIVERRNVNIKDYVKRKASKTDCSRIIDEPCLIYEGDELKIALIELPARDIPFEKALQSIKYSKDTRTSGLKTNSRIFGFMPRVTIREDYCHVAGLEWHNPKAHRIVCNKVKEIIPYYEKLFPKQFNHHKSIIEDKVLNDYQIHGSVFTSGIINQNNPLNYHFDSGNFAGCLSAMYINKKNCLGGNLACPEYDILIKLKDNQLLLFDGQSILHGVTGFKLFNGGHRYTTVFYSLKQMWNCEPITEELARIKQKRWEREQKRLETIKNAIE